MNYFIYKTYGMPLVYFEDFCYYFMLYNIFNIVSGAAIIYLT